MRYASGKNRISKEISENIRSFERERERESNTLVSLFCGTCSIEIRLQPYFDRVICNDKQEYLIEMYKSIQNGYELPDFVSEEQYKYIREHKDEDKALTGFVGFGCSFGAKWFGGYARNSVGRNYAKESKKSIIRDFDSLSKMEFCNLDYREVELPDICIIYADPPYQNTTAGYGLSENFNSDEFWNYAREVSKTHLMFISEQQAPDDFVCIWEKPFTRTMDRNKSNQFKVTEKLFVHKCNYKGE